MASGVAAGIGSAGGIVVRDLDEADLVPSWLKGKCHGSITLRARPKGARSTGKADITKLRLRTSYGLSKEALRSTPLSVVRIDTVIESVDLFKEHRDRMCCSESPVNRWEIERTIRRLFNSSHSIGGPPRPLRRRVDTGDGDQLCFSLTVQHGNPLAAALAPPRGGLQPFQHTALANSLDMPRRDPYLSCYLGVSTGRPMFSLVCSPWSARRRTCAVGGSQPPQMTTSVVGV